MRYKRPHKNKAKVHKKPAAKKDNEELMKLLYTIRMMAKD